MTTTSTTATEFPKVMSNRRGERWLVTSITASDITAGPMAGAENVTARRWIKSRSDWAKQEKTFLAWTASWTTEEA